MKKSHLLCMLVAAAAFSLGLSSQAAPVVRLSDGSTTLQIGDSSSFSPQLDRAQSPDQSPDFTYVGTLGSNWMLSLASAPGSLQYTVNASNIGAGGTHLDLELSDTDFFLSSVSSLAQFLGNITGKTEGMVTWWMFVDDGNDLFAQTTEIGRGTNSSGAFVADFDGLGLVDGGFSMTLLVRINHGNGERLTSFDFQGISQLVPEPGTIMLLGIGLLGLTLRRRHMR